MNMNPSQNDILAAELLRLQKARGGGNNADVFSQLVSQQHPAVGGGALGSGGVQSFDQFRGGLDFPSITSLGNASGLLASDFALSQSLAGSLHVGVTGGDGAHYLSGDARTRHQPIMMNNNTHHIGLPTTSNPGYLRSSVDLSSNRGLEGYSPLMANSQLAAKSLMSDRFAGTHSSAMHRLLANNHLSPEGIHLLLASQSQTGSALDFRTAGYSTGNMISPSLLPLNGAVQQATLQKQDDPGWEEQYKALREYHQQFGHCKVPARYKPNSKLGRWVMTQRRQFTLLMQGLSSALTAERIRRLDDLGFTWQVRPEPATTWNKRLQELRAYRAAHGSCNVPQRYQANLPLGTWVHTQRRQYKLRKEGKKNSMTQEKIEALESIDFNWDAKLAYSSAAPADKVTTDIR